MEKRTNMIPSKKWTLALLAGMAFLMTACSGVKGGTTTGGGSGSGGGATTFTVGGTVVGLKGTGLIIADNTSDTLTITADGPFTFKVATSGAYLVLVQTQPSNPAQVCSVLNGKGTATAIATPSSSIGTTSARLIPRLSTASTSASLAKSLSWPMP